MNLASFRSVLVVVIPHYNVVYSGNCHRPPGLSQEVLFISG